MLHLHFAKGQLSMTIFHSMQVHAVDTQISTFDYLLAAFSTRDGMIIKVHRIGKKHTQKLALGHLRVTFCSVMSHTVGGLFPSRGISSGADGRDATSNFEHNSIVLFHAQYACQLQVNESDFDKSGDLVIGRWIHMFSFTNNPKLQCCRRYFNLNFVCSSVIFSDPSGRMQRVSIC